jgi:hypothetical protein
MAVKCKHGDSYTMYFCTFTCNNWKLINDELKKHGGKEFDGGKKIVVFNKLFKNIEGRKFKTALRSLGFY